MYYPIILAVIVSLYGIYSLPEVKGWVGELAAKIALLMLPHDEYIIMNNIYIPAYDGMYTQIDHLVISASGIIVVETKNYSGKLSGSSRKKYWTAYRDGEYGQVYNPIRQNAYHIRMLKENCPKIANIKIFSVICLSFGAKVKVETSIPVVNPMSLIKIVEAINNKKPVNQIKLSIIENMIKEIVINGKTAAKEHKKRLAVRRARLRRGFCPRCNARLLKKRGVKGEYLICSNYPLCKFRATNSL